MKGSFLLCRDVLDLWRAVLLDDRSPTLRLLLAGKGCIRGDVYCSSVDFRYSASILTRVGGFEHTKLSADAEHAH